jgi:biotin carboxyl carrier protein
MKYEATVEGKTFQIEVTDTGKVFVDGAEHALDFRSIDGLALYSLLLDNTSYEMLIDEESGHFHVLVQGEPFAVRVREVLDVNVNRPEPAPPLKGKMALTAPIPGVVVRVLVQEGDAAEAGQILAVLESMKMENELRAPGAGIVREVKVAVEDEVNQTQVLIVFEVL